MKSHNRSGTRSSPAAKASSSAAAAISPLGKKLIQARLPFKSVAPSAKAAASPAAGSPSTTAKRSPEASVSGTDDGGVEAPRKRKLSANSSPSGNGLRSAKVNRVESKENVNVTVELSSSGESESGPTAGADSPGNKCAAPKTPASQKRTPNGQPRKSGSASKSRKRKAASPVLVLDDSSASQPDAGTAFAIKLPVPKKRASATAMSPKRCSPRTSLPRNAPAALATPVSSKSGPAKAESPNVTPVRLTTKAAASPAAKDSPAGKAGATPVRQIAVKGAKESPLAKKLARTPVKNGTPAGKAQAKRRSPRQPAVAVAEAIARPNDGDAKSAHGSLNRSAVDDDDSNLSDDESSLASQPAKDDQSATEPVGTPVVPAKQPTAKKPTPGRSARKTADGEERAREKQRLAEERAREREEKERQRRKEREDREEQKRAERERKRQDELEEKRRRDEQREEEKRKKDEQREEEKRKKDEQREEEKRKKDEQREQREEERRRKEEHREEERRKRDEEKLAKEEAEKRKTEKSMAVFSRFFVAAPKKDAAEMGGSAAAAEASASVDGTPESVASAATGGDGGGQTFMPFRVKDDMKLAPLVRRVFGEKHRRAFDGLVVGSAADARKSGTYLEQLRAKSVPRGRDGRTWSQDEADVLIVDDELEGADAIAEDATAKRTYRAKFFKFHENRRPPYYGTWRRRSKTITARRPLAADTAHFDYECDSDDEWEEEEPGESLHGSDDEKDKESDDEYDIDNQFFVPHGHLSDEEMDDDAADDDDDDEDDDEKTDAAAPSGSAELDDNSPFAQKAKLKIMQMQFASEMKKKTEKIKPRLVGCVWQTASGQRPAECVARIWEMLCARRMQFGGRSIRLEPVGATNDEGSMDDDGKAKGPSRRVKMADGDVGDLIRLLHGNRMNKNFLCNEFQAFLRAKHGRDYLLDSKKSIYDEIKRLGKYQACPDAGEWHGRTFWYVPEECRLTYGVSDARLPNEWRYTLALPTRRMSVAVERVRNDGADADELAGDSDASLDAKSNGTLANGRRSVSQFNIAQFTKVLSEEDKRKQFEVAASAAAVANDAGSGGDSQPALASPGEKPAKAAAGEKSAKPAPGDKQAKPAPGEKPTKLAPGEKPAKSAPGDKQAKPAPIAATKSNDKPATAVNGAGAPAVRKRATLLASVPLHQKLPDDATKKALVSDFLQRTAKKPAPESPAKQADSAIIVLD